MLPAQVLPDKGKQVLPGDGIKHLRKQQRVKAVKAALHHGNSHGLKGIQALEGGAIVGPQDAFKVVCINAILYQTPGLLQHQLRHGMGILAVSAHVGIGCAREGIEAVTEGAVDKPLAIEPCVQRAGVAQQHIAGQLPDEGAAHLLLTAAHGRALEAQQKRGHGDLHLAGGLRLQGG